MQKSQHCILRVRLLRIAHVTFDGLSGKLIEKKKFIGETTRYKGVIRVGQPAGRHVNIRGTHKKTTAFRRPQTRLIAPHMYPSTAVVLTDKRTTARATPPSEDLQNKRGYMAVYQSRHPRTTDGAKDQRNSTHYSLCKMLVDVGRMR